MKKCSKCKQKAIHVYLVNEDIHCEACYLKQLPPAPKRELVEEVTSFEMKFSIFKEADKTYSIDIFEGVSLKTAECIHFPSIKEAKAAVEHFIATPFKMGGLATRL